LPLGLMIGGALLYSSGEKAGFLTLVAEAFIIGLVLAVIFPRRYQVYEDHVRIVLGGPFSVRIGFDQIETIETTGRTHFTINFATTMAKTYVRIERKSGLSIAITPKSNELFVENANRALQEWARTRRDVSAL